MIFLVKQLTRLTINGAKDSQDSDIQTEEKVSNPEPILSNPEPSLQPVERLFLFLVI